MVGPAPPYFRSYPPGAFQFQTGSEERNPLNVILSEAASEAAESLFYEHTSVVLAFEQNRGHISAVIPDDIAGED